MKGRLVAFGYLLPRKEASHLMPNLPKIPKSPKQIPDFYTHMYELTEEPRAWHTLLPRLELCLFILILVPVIYICIYLYKYIFRTITVQVQGRRIRIWRREYANAALMVILNLTYQIRVIRQFVEEWDSAFKMPSCLWLGDIVSWILLLSIGQALVPVLVGGGRWRRLECVTGTLLFGLVIRAWWVIGENFGAERGGGRGWSGALRGL